MRSSLVVRASDCQCTSCNGPGFDPSIRRHSGIWGAADEAVLNIVRTKRKNPPKKYLKKKKKNSIRSQLGSSSQGNRYSTGKAGGTAPSTCRVTLLQPARRAAMLGQPSSLRPHGLQHTPSPPSTVNQLITHNPIVTVFVVFCNFQWHVGLYTVIRFVWGSDKFGTCPVVSVYGTFFEAKLCTFTLDSTHFIFNKIPIYNHDGASAKFSINSHETDYSVPS